MRLGLVTIAIAAIASPAMAIPGLTWETTYLGAGLAGYTVSVVNDVDGAVVAVNLDFDPVEQIQAYGHIDVDWQDDAILYNADPAANYDMLRDSWIFTGWSDPVIGPDPDPVWAPPGEPFHMHVSRPDLELGPTPLCYVVGPAAGLCPVAYSGVIALSGIDYAVSGCIPEPVTTTLLALGALVALRRRRRTARTNA